MSSNIILSGSLSMSGTNMPTRAGQRVITESEITNISAPFIGSIVYIEDKDTFVYVKSLKSKKIGNFEIMDALVDEYKPLAVNTNDEINLNWNEVL